jgi:hypothetical protein
MEFKLNHESAAHEGTGSARRYVVRLVLILTAIAFALADTAVVAWYAGVVTGAEVVAYGFAFTLISIGVLVTAGNLQRLS